MKCLACSSADTKPYINVKSLQYFECRQCGCVFLPQATTTNLSDFHKRREYKLSRLLSESRSAALRTWLVKLMQRYQPKGKMLEVGCSAGFFLKATSEAGYEVIGIDLGDENVIFGKYFLGVTIINGDFLQLDNSLRPDWIVMNQLIEHVVNPREFIRKARSLLVPNGHLLITTPNLALAEWLIKWPKRFGLKPIIIEALVHPNHCVLFKPQALKQVLAKEGFSNLEVGHNPTGFIGERRLRRLVDRFMLRFMPNSIGPNFWIIGKLS